MKTRDIQKTITIFTDDSNTTCAFNCPFLVDHTNKEDQKYWCTLFQSVVWNRSRYNKCIESCGEVVIYNCSSDKK